MNRQRTAAAFLHTPQPLPAKGGRPSCVQDDCGRWEGKQQAGSSKLIAVSGQRTTDDSLMPANSPNKKAPEFSEAFLYFMGWYFSYT